MQDPTGSSLCPLDGQLMSEHQLAGYGRRTSVRGLLRRPWRRVASNIRPASTGSMPSGKATAGRQRRQIVQLDPRSERGEHTAFANKGRPNVIEGSP